MRRRDVTEHVLRRPTGDNRNFGDDDPAVRVRSYRGERLINKTDSALPAERERFRKKEGNDKQQESPSHAAVLRMDRAERRPEFRRRVRRETVAHDVFGDDARDEELEQVIAAARFRAAA